MPLGLSLGLATLGSGDVNVGGWSGTTVQRPDETGLRRGQGTYQLVDAVNGPVVLVTEPLHAFEAEKGKGKALVTAKLRRGHREATAPLGPAAAVPGGWEGCRVKSYGGGPGRAGHEGLGSRARAWEGAGEIGGRY